jgi:Na+/phosphate symporter
MISQFKYKGNLYMEKIENNIGRERTLEEICRAMGVPIESMEKVKDLFLEMAKTLKKVAEEFLKICEKIINSIDIDKYKKFIKYEKRVRNRNKLYKKRKHKYGK